MSLPPLRRKACSGLGRANQFGDLIKKMEPLLSERGQVFVRRRRNAILDIVNLAPDVVVLLKQGLEVGIANLEPMDGLGVAGEFLLKGVIQVFRCHAPSLAGLNRRSLIWRNYLDRSPLTVREHFGLVVEVRARDDR
ncbi:MAG: hypothetical protein R3C27_00375 [Hyphomonadaceae bacterium]